MGPVSMVDASVSFPKATIADFKDEADGVLDVVLLLETKDVHIVEK